MNGRLDAMNNNMNERLDSLEDSVEEIKSTVEQCCNDSTGSFLDPAHNCSHILQSDPTARSGNTNYTYTFISVLVIVHMSRSLLATEQPWLCSEGVL